MIWRYFGISSSCSPPSLSRMIRRCLPLVSLPNETTPEISARIAGSLGLRASNRSATRGRPPVMSRVFDASCGILATRSEEHTSELQSLMRISYAVFCLKKKKTTIKSELVHIHDKLTKHHRQL